MREVRLERKAGMGWVLVATGLVACSSSVVAPMDEMESGSRVQPRSASTEEQPAVREPTRPREPSGQEPPPPLAPPPIPLPPPTQPMEVEPWGPAAPRPPLDGPRLSVAPEPGYQFGPQQNIVGDLDGDGFDDIIASALVMPDLNAGFAALAELRGALYVFYGREDFPESSRASDADAVLRGPGVGMISSPRQAGAFGDLNGDGLDDAVVGGAFAAYFIFGSEERLAGEYEIDEVTASWVFEPGPLNTPTLAPTIVSAGDVQGDGLLDFMLTLPTGVRTVEVNGGTSTSQTHSAYLVLGHAEAWPEGAFDPEWAAATFEEPEPVRGVVGLGAADLNGDDFADLLLQTDGLTRLIPGEAEPANGVISAKEAGVPFPMDAHELLRLPDLSGDGRDDIAWSPQFTGTVRLWFQGTDTPPDQQLLPDVEIVGEGLSLHGVAVADVDEDGENELVIAAGQNRTAPSALYVLERPDLHPEVHLDELEPALIWDPDDRAIPGRPTGRLTTVLDAGGDVNGDGRVDLLVATGEVQHLPAMMFHSELTLILGRSLDQD